MFVVTVLFEINPSHVDAFRVAVLQHAKNSLTQEPGCKRFDVSVDPDNPRRFFLYEVYDDAAALETHRGADYLQQFGTTIEGWVEEKQLNVWEQISF